MSNKQTNMCINKKYYDKYNCKFAFCESCYWFASILKEVFKNNQCPRCEKKMYVERIIK